MTAKDKLNARLVSLPTAQLIEISLRLAADLSREACIVASAAETVLMDRMTEAEFVAHMEKVEAALDAAA